MLGFRVCFFCFFLLVLSSSLVFSPKPGQLTGEKPRAQAKQEKQRLQEAKKELKQEAVSRAQQTKRREGRSTAQAEKAQKDFEEQVVRPKRGDGFGFSRQNLRDHWFGEHVSGPCFTTCLTQVAMQGR